MIFELQFRGFTKGRNPSKNRRMPHDVASTRYSLVKGERIVRFVLTARLRDLLSKWNPSHIVALSSLFSHISPVWDSYTKIQTTPPSKWKLPSLEHKVDRRMSSLLEIEPGSLTWNISLKFIYNWTWAKSLRTRD